MELETMEETMEKTLKEIMPSLINDGVEKIVLEYNGYGDSGLIDWCCFTGSDGNHINLDTEKYGYLITEPRSMSIEDVCMEIAYNLLPCGFEINEGSIGKVTIDLKDGEVTVEHGWRRVEVDYETSKYKL